jgi:hypothetical protein
LKDDRRQDKEVDVYKPQWGDRWADSLSRSKKKRGLLRAGLDGICDVLSAGGTYRVREKSRGIIASREELRKLSEGIASAEETIKADILAIGEALSVSMRQLHEAERLLSPLGKTLGAYSSSHGQQLEFRGGPIDLALTEFTNQYKHFMNTALGAGAGTVAAAGLWGGVQLLGHASTGAALASLHGAAASSAGWAWFGGGSLAAGGGGMALGHFILPGIGTVVAIGLSATLSHSEANRLDKQLAELQKAVEHNQKILSKIRVKEREYSAAAGRIFSSAGELKEAVAQASRVVGRFGLLSYYFRFWRYRFLGYFYTTSEMEVISRLEKSVDAFLSVFHKP